jgi:ComF family protein
LDKPALTKMRSVYFYEDLVKRMIHEAKFARKARILSFFAEAMYLQARAEFPSSVQAIVPVPMHKSKEWIRTFNQAERLATLMARYWDIPIWKSLRKTRKTASQSSLPEYARRRNLKGAFVYSSRIPAPRSVVLVDDVFTTGATLQECARTLRKAGVRRIYGITAARAVKLF